MLRNAADNELMRSGYGSQNEIANRLMIENIAAYGPKAVEKLPIAVQNLVDLMLSAEPEAQQDIYEIVKIMMKKRKKQSEHGGAL